MAPMTSGPWFSVFGYSFTGAFALWLAHLTGRVDAVVSGDFPIAGDYSPPGWTATGSARVLPRSRPRRHAGPHQ
jgi:hypothetical protein